MSVSARRIRILIVVMVLLFPVSVTSAANLAAGQNPMIQATITTGNASRTVQPTQNAPLYIPTPVSSPPPVPTAGISTGTITSQPTDTAVTPLPTGVIVGSIPLALFLVGRYKKKSQ